MFEQLKTNSDLHLLRKLFHFSSLFVIFLCMVFLSQKVNWTLYILLGGPALLFDLLRQNSPALNRFALIYLKPIMRKTEIRKVSGASFAILAVGFTYLVFPLPAAHLSILFLAVGDPIASFFGLLLGKHILFGKKSLEGFVAAFVFCSLSAALYLYFYTQVTSSLTLLSLCCGFIGALAELIPIAQLDDNLTQPLISSTLMTIFFSIWGGPF